MVSKGGVLDRIMMHLKNKWDTVIECVLGTFPLHLSISWDYVPFGMRGFVELCLSTINLKSVHITELCFLNPAVRRQPLSIKGQEDILLPPNLIPRTKSINNLRNGSRL